MAWPLFAFGLLASGCALMPAGLGAVLPPETLATSAEAAYLLVVSLGTATPFQPDAITSTPLPSATLTPSPAPTATTVSTSAAETEPPFNPETNSSSPTPFPDYSQIGQINFLLLGSDTRGGVSFRTDTMVIVSVNPAENIVSLISIPRDLWVFLPGAGYNRINTAYLTGEQIGYPGGGASHLKETILLNLGVPIDHLVLVDFEGFVELVDAVGGIDIPLACPFTEWRLKRPELPIDDPDNWKLVTLYPGLVHMDGEMSLWYARARLRSNDFDRGRRQQEVLRALFSAAVDEGLLLQTAELYKRYKNTVESDVNLKTILSLVPLAINLDEAQIRSYYINDDLVSGWITPGGASVLLPRGPEIAAMMAQALSPEPLPDEEAIVEVLNWTDNPAWDQLAAARLHYAGFPTVIGESTKTNATRTLLFSLSEKPDDELSAELLQALGLTQSDLRNDPQLSSPAPYRLVLGSDYDPCFQPADLVN